MKATKVRWGNMKIGSTLYIAVPWAMCFSSAMQQMCCPNCAQPMDWLNVHFSITQYGLWGNDDYVECVECHNCHCAFAAVQQMEVGEL